MPLPSRAIRSALKGKHGFEEDPSRDHIWFYKWHDGRVVAKTKLSHGRGGRDVSDQLIGTMARQLHVSGPEFRQAVSCQLEEPAFLERMLD